MAWRWRIRSRTLRWTRNVLLGLVALVVLVLGGAHLWLLTDAGRGYVRAQVVPLISDALGGKLAIDRIDALSVFGLRAHGVSLRAPDGEVLATVRSLEASLSPLELVLGRVHVTRIELSDAFVDLGAPADEGGGLIGLFTEQPEEPAEPEAEGGGLDIVLDGIALQRGQLLVRLNGEAWEARGLTLAGSIAVREQLALKVRQLSGKLWRSGEAAGALASATGQYDPQRRSHGHVDLRVADGRLVVRGRLDPLDSRGAQPLRAWVRAEKLGRSTLTALGLDAVARDWPLQPLALQLNAHGDLTALDAQLAIDTGAERLSARARWAEARGLSVNPLRVHWPGALLRARGELHPDGGFAADIGIDAAQLARSPALVELVPGIAGALAADVHVERDAEGVLDAQLDVALHAGGVAENRVRKLHVTGQLHGRELERVQGRIAVDAEKLQAGPAALDRARLVLHGEPGRFALEGRFAPSGVLRASADHEAGRGWTIDAAFDVPLTTREQPLLAARQAQSAANERLILAKPKALLTDRAAERRKLTLRAQLADAKPSVLHARVQKLQIAPSGRIAVQRVALAYRDARAELSGALDPGRPDGEVALSAKVTVPQLSAPMALLIDAPVHGSLALSARARGRLRTPHVELDARYRCPAVEGLRNVELDLSADADLRAQRVRSDTKLRADGTALRLTSDSRIRALSEAGLRRARHEIALTVDRLPLHVLERWPQAPVVPDVLVLAGHVKASGTLRDYALDSALRARALFADADAPLDAWVELDYADKQVALELRVSDKQGPLLRTAVKTELEGPEIALDRADLERVLAQRGWDAALWLGARRIDELPAMRALGVPEALWPARVSAKLALAHQPGTEPEGEVSVRAAWDPPGKVTEAPLCGTVHAPYVQLSVKMARGELHGELGAGSAGRDSLAVTMASHAPLNEWLQVKPEQVRPVQLKARFTDLELGNVPVVCEQVRGRLTGAAQLSRALTRAVTLSAQVQGKRLVFIDAPPIDVALEANASGERVLAKGTIAAPGSKGKATIDAELPLDAGGRMPTLSSKEPLRVDVKLYDVPAPALVASVPNVRASSGTLGGWLGLRGSVLDPQLRGRVDLRDVTMTLGELGQRFERANGTLALEGRTLRIQKLRFGDLGGRAELEAEVKLHALDPLALDAALDVKAKRLPIRRGGVLAAHLDGTLGAKIHIDPERIDVLGTLRKARIELAEAATTQPQSLADNPDIVFSDEPPAALQDEDEAQTAQPLRIRIDARQPFWVRRSDFSALVSTDLTIESKEGTPSVVGVVKVERGVIELLGQLFDIERGTIEFTGGHAIEPTLDIAATRRVPGSGDVVRVEARGSVHEPELSFSIDGRPTTAGEALAAALGTRTSEDGSSNVESEMSSMATGIAGSVLTLAARRELGPWVPVLALERGAGETRIRAGVEADRFIPGFLRKVVVDAYVEGIVSTQEQTESGQVQAESSTGAAVLLELRFPHDLMTEAQYGPGQRWSLDFGWEP